MNVRKQISVVIITRDRSESLLETLRKMTALPEAIDIVVVDNGSSGDATAQVCRQFPQVRLLSLGRNLGAAARNLGVEAAGTPYVAFCDDDSWWEAGALATAVSYFEQYPRVGLIAGKVLVGPDRKIDPVSDLQARSPLPHLTPMPGPAILGFLACGTIVRASAFLEAGGFHERFILSGEEQLLAIDLVSAGWGLTYAEDLVAYHFPSPQRLQSWRVAMSARNHIWTAWLRRPWPAAARVTLGEVGKALGDRDVARGMAEAGLGMPAILRQRRVAPPYVERQIRLLEEQERLLALGTSLPKVASPVVADRGAEDAGR